MRRSWRLMAAAAVLLAAASIYLSAKLFSITQQERQRNVEIACQSTNERGREAGVALDRLLLERLTGRQSPRLAPAVVAREVAAKIKSLPKAERMQVEQSRAASRILIGKLVPIRANCGAYARLQVQTVPGPSLLP